MLLGDFNGVLRNNGRLSIVPHTEMEQYLGRYAGLMLYLKEMDEAIYAKLCAVCRKRFMSGHQLMRIIGLLLSCKRAALDASQGTFERVPCDYQEGVGRRAGSRRALLVNNCIAG